MLEIPHDPILSLSQAHAFEQEYFNGDEALQWDAMTRAGEAVADSALRDMRELRTIPHRPKLMVLVGKGHNGADALIAARRFLRTIPTARAAIWPWTAMEECRPMTQRAFKELIDFATKRLEVLPVANEMNVEGLGEILSSQAKGRGVDLLIDGLLGIQARANSKKPFGRMDKAAERFRKYIRPCFNRFTHRNHGVLNSGDRAIPCRLYLLHGHSEIAGDKEF